MNIEVNYRINDEDTSTMEISRSTTVGEFLDEILVLKDDPELAEVYLYDRQLDPEELIINFPDDIHTDVFVISHCRIKLIDKLIESSDEVVSIAHKKD